MDNIYYVAISDFGITPTQISSSINNILINAKKSGKTEVVLPKADYIISETSPIVLVDNIILNLNGATLKINPNGLQAYNIVKFSGCSNAKVINGTLLGDRYEHDYTTVKGSHEWGCAVAFDDCENCSIDNLNIKSVTGYGVTSSLGKNISNLVIGVTVQNLQIGNIDSLGKLNSESGTIRTINPTDISKVGGSFELGYNKGYMGYPFMKAKVYDSYFYDKDMNFISSIKNCIQYKKVDIPQNSVYVQFVFNQSTLPTRGDTDFSNTTVFITNYKSPYKATISNCNIEDNRSLGMGLCGGRDFTIENNTFINNKGNAPNYAIDMEDGWEYMDKFLFKGNKFINNANDIVICAGDNISFEANEFTSTVYMWGRATNYKFINNKFNAVKQTINYEYSSDTICTGNTYIDSKIGISSIGSGGNFIIANETFINSNINTMPSNVELLNSNIERNNTASMRILGNYNNCVFNNLGGDIISANITNSTIKNTSVNCQGICNIDNTIIEGTSFGSTNTTKEININKCGIKDSKVTIATWGAATRVNVIESNISMVNSKNAFIEISAGKISMLNLINNTISNYIAKPTIYMYDASYTIPNGNLYLEKNTINQSSYKYVFDGVNITSGTLNLISKDNILGSLELVNPKYLNNKFFIITK